LELRMKQKTVRIKSDVRSSGGWRARLQKKNLWFETPIKKPLAIATDVECLEEARRAGAKKWTS